MNWLDAVLLLLLAWSMVTAFRKGFTREIIGVISVIVGILAGVWFYGSAARILLPYVSSRAAANFGGFLAVFCGVLLLGALVSYLVRKFLRLTGLSFFDRLLGAGFGLLACWLLNKYRFVSLPGDVYFIKNLPVQLQAQDIVVVCVAAIVITFAATIYPALKAARLVPLEAIRYE